MNWGFRIAFLYIGFIAMIVTLVSLTMKQKVDLVATDYYEQELTYQQRINQIERTEKLNGRLSWELRENNLVFNFPPEFKGQQITGTILFFRPSDASKDKRISISAGKDGVQTVPLSELSKGHYKLQVSWKVSEEYFNEGVISIR